MDPKDITSMGELSAEELEALTEAGEIKADAADDDADEIEAADGETDGDDDDGDAAKVAADKAAADAAAAKTAADEAAAKAETDKAAEVEDDEAPFVPDYGANPERLKEITTRLEVLSTEKEALRQKFSDGDIDQDKYLAEYDKLSDERNDLNADKRVLEAAAAQSLRHAEQIWDADQRRFWSKDENGIFSRTKDPILFEAFNAQVMALGRQFPDRSGFSILREAAQTIRDKFNLEGETKPAVPLDPKAEADKAKRKAAADRVKTQADKQTKAPQTLADIPAAAESDEELTDGEFAELDALLGDGSRDPMEVEAMIARMGPEAERRFGTVRH